VSLAEPEAPRVDLGLLVDDDLSSKAAHHGFFSVAQFRPGHTDGAVMMGHHHRGEILIDVSDHGVRQPRLYPSLSCSFPMGAVTISIRIGFAVNEVSSGSRFIPPDTKNSSLFFARASRCPARFLI
jgi:hypothetical protein